MDVSFLVALMLDKLTSAANKVLLRRLIEAHGKSKSRISLKNKTVIFDPLVVFSDASSAGKKLELFKVTSELEKQYFDHINQNITWSKNISFDLLNNDRSLDDVYIDLDVYINPVRNNLGSKDKTPKGRLLDKIYESNQHIVVLGQPGAGKTTSMKKIFKSLVEGKDKFVNQSKLPILIRLRDFDSKHESIEFPIREKILSFFNFQLYVKDFDGALVELVLKDNFSLFLEEINALIILDGFDEIPNQYLKNAVLREFRDLCTSLHKSKLVLTSRSADFQFDITNCSKNEIAALDDNQISNFAEKWLGTRKESQVFLDKIKASPFRDSTIKPINLAHLCVIYQRTKTIPKKIRRDIQPHTGLDD